MTSPFEKRIRRHVIGKSHRFFAVTAPGLEPLCRGELESLGITGAAVEGGVEFSGRLQAAYLANLCLRTANRILLRVHEFRATNFRALAQEAAATLFSLHIACCKRVAINQSKPGENGVSADIDTPYGTIANRSSISVVPTN